MAMRTTIGAAAAAGLLGLALAGCTPEYRPETHNEGDSAVQNFMLQAVNPQPNSATTAPDQDGQTAAAAWERYREGKVIKPSRVTTSELGSGGASAK
jgi:hypothetical protein